MTLILDAAPVVLRRVAGGATHALHSRLDVSWVRRDAITVCLPRHLADTKEAPHVAGLHS